MAIIILLISFLLLFCNIWILLGYKINMKETLLCSVLIFSCVLLFITEMTSLFHQLNFQFILISWVAFSILNIFYLFLKKDNLLNLKILLQEKTKRSFIQLNKYEKILFFTIISILFLMFIQGIIYPPNNWDSMTYHLARIPNWISHQSVNHYPTHILRQLYQPPFSEFIILHFNILNGHDYFSNSVQFFYLCFSMVIVVLIIEQFGLKYQYKLVALILTVTIPEVILQASSTQNDIVVSFFILSSVYFGANAIKKSWFLNYFFFGISIGLCILTKGTAYLYLIPIILIFAVVLLIQVYKTKKYTSIKYSIIAAVLCISINSIHYFRNYKLAQNILGVDKNESKMYSNEKMNTALFLSNIIKNAGLHTGSFPINHISDDAIRKLHSIIGVDIDDATINFNNINYSSPPEIPNQEDTASNLLHFFLIITSITLISINMLKSKMIFNIVPIYLVMILLQIILFCLYLKWQPWHTRLHTPLFMLSIPLICSTLSLNIKYITYFYRIVPFILFSAFLIVAINYSRPYFSNKYTSNISLKDERYKKYFANRLELYQEYNNTVKNIHYLNYKRIGLILSTDDWEYPLFSMFYGEKKEPIHINVSNISKKLSVNTDNIDCIISTTTNDSIITYNSKRFFNLNKKNKFIWIYGY
jgi:hypothetical protein